MIPNDNANAIPPLNPNIVVGDVGWRTADQTIEIIIGWTAYVSPLERIETESEKERKKEYLQRR